VIDPLSDAAFTDLSQQGLTDADRALRVRFFYESIRDPVLSDGGELKASDPRVAIAKEKGLEVSPATDDAGKPVKGRVQIEGAGRPIFVPVEMCEIRVDRDNVVVQRVTDAHRHRFPGQYAKHKAGEKHQEAGTLLRKWGLIDEADALSYEASGIYTVEQLAAQSDAACQQSRGMLRHRQVATDFLETAKGLAPVAAARAEAEKLRAELDALREQVAEMKRAPVEEPAPRKRRAEG
jgi:hypothetical protein